MSAPRRILIYGVYGSGKSTLAARLAEHLGLPWYPVDDLVWQPGWVEVPVAQQRSRIEEVCRRDRWIIDGAYHGWRDVPLARADLVVGLDYPRWLLVLAAAAAHRAPGGDRRGDLQRQP